MNEIDYDRPICLLPNTKKYIRENNIYLTNAKIDLDELNPKLKKLANAVSFRIAANLDLIVSFYDIYVDGYPLNTNSGFKLKKSARNKLSLLHVDQTGKQKITDWLPYLEKCIGNYRNTSINELLNNVIGVEIDYNKKL